MLSSTKLHIDGEGGDALFRWMGFRRRTSKSVKKNFEKSIDFYFRMWYNVYVKRRGAVRQTRPFSDTYGVTADRPHLVWALAIPLSASYRIEPPRRSAAGGAWQSAFLSPRTVAKRAIPEEPSPITCALGLIDRSVSR